MKILLLVTLYLLLALAIWHGLKVFEERNLYYPEKAFEHSPADYHLPFEEVTLETEDQKKIHGWFIGAEAPTATLLYCHGNGGNISHRLEKARFFYRLGYSTFLFDYRGYGKSEGKPSEKGTYKDGEAAYRYLTETRKIPADQIVFYGESLGGGIAVELARQRPGKALILENAFTSTVKMAELYFPWLPARWVVRHRYDNLSKMPEIKIPVLIMHTREDEIIPFSMGQVLYQAVPGPKMFLELSGDHNGAYLIAGDTYTKGIQEFLTKT